MMGKVILKCKNAAKGYSAAYLYTNSFGKQKVFIKYPDDVQAIDLLLERGFESQILGIMNWQSGNEFSKVENGRLARRVRQ